MCIRSQGSANPTLEAIYSSALPFAGWVRIFLAGFPGDDVRNGIK